jgi:hypothetical protein
MILKKSRITGNFPDFGNRGNNDLDDQAILDSPHFKGQRRANLR